MAGYEKQHYCKDKITWIYSLFTIPLKEDNSYGIPSYFAKYVLSTTNLRSGNLKNINFKIYNLEKIILTWAPG